MIFDNAIQGHENEQFSWKCYAEFYGIDPEDPEEFESYGQWISRHVQSWMTCRPVGQDFKHWLLDVVARETQRQSSYTFP